MQGGVYDGCILTIGNYLMTFSDYFPQGQEYRFWSAEEYYNYLVDYVGHFQLEDKARFEYNTEVLSISRQGEAWQVSVKDVNGETRQTVFDRVAVCNGAHQVANVPTLPGQASSAIEICHSETYKHASKDPRFHNKRVVCVGIGETGADVAAHLAQHSKDAYLSMRRAPHVVPRNIWNLGYPGDAYSTRAMFYCNHMYISALHAFDQWTKLKTAGPKGQKFFKGGYFSSGYQNVQSLSIGT